MQAFRMSKETQDKVKLAKKYIQDKYQTFIKEQKNIESKWGQIYSLMKEKNIPDQDKLKIQNQIKQKLVIKQRMARQKDCLKNYELHQLIGRGAFGDVRIAKNKATNQIVAIKIMEKKKLISKKQISTAYLQRQLMIKNSSSRYLVNLYSTFQDKKFLYIVMEYIGGGDLLHLLIQKDIFTQQETKFYIAQIVLAVEEIHSKNYIHRDIKPDNILINKNGHIKISDFGLSKYLENSQISNNNERKFKKDKQQKDLTKLKFIKQRTIRKFSKVGTPDYISPEVLTSQTYDHLVDIWSIGVIMFECLFGYPPFSDDDSQQVCHKVVNWAQYLQFPSDIKVSMQAKMLILSLMSDRKSRIYIPQIKKHPFFLGINWQKVYLYKPPMIPKINHELDTQNFETILENIDQAQIKIKNQQQDQFNQEDIDKKQQNQGIYSNKRNRSVSQQICFAGFQYKKNDIDAFGQSQKILTNMRRSHKVLNHCKLGNQNSLKIIKRVHTQQQNKFNLSQKSFYKNQNQNLKKVISKFKIKKQGQQAIIPFLQDKNSIKRIAINKFFKKDPSWKKA